MPGCTISAYSRLANLSCPPETLHADAMIVLAMGSYAFLSPVELVSTLSGGEGSRAHATFDLSVPSEVILCGVVGDEEV